jgi:hypothetical protein
MYPLCTNAQTRSLGESQAFSKSEGRRHVMQHKRNFAPAWFAGNAHVQWSTVFNGALCNYVVTCSYASRGLQLGQLRELVLTGRA